MFSTNDIVKQIDYFRCTNKMTIQEICQGVMSRKKYTRLLNGEADISFDEIMALMNRIHIPFQEFILYLTNTIEGKYPDESSFCQAIISADYNDAFETHYLKLGPPPYKTTLGRYAVGAFIHLMFFKLGKKDRLTSLQQLKLDFPLAKFTHGSIVEDNQICVLYAYVNMCDDKEKIIIGRYISTLLNDDRTRLLVTFSSFSLNLLYKTGILAYTTLDYLDEENAHHLSSIIKIALAYQIKARQPLADFLLFEMIHQFYRRIGKKNKYLTFYYITTFISSFGGEDLSRLDINEDDIRTFSLLMKDKDFRNSPMYERLLEDEI